MLKNIRAIARMVLLFLIILNLLVSVLLVAVIQSPSTQRRKRVARTMQRHLKALSWVAGLEVHVKGARPPEDQSFLLLSNHVSYWDILALGALFPIGFMAKDCIAHWPVLGTVTRLCNTIFVNREQVLARWKSLRSLQTQILDLPYCVFPEGTTTASVAPKFSHWRRGNIAVMREPGVQVWLAGLHYAQQSQQAWIDDDALLPHLLRVLKAPRIELMIHMQPLALAADLTLTQAAQEAWHGTVRLCKKAQQDWIVPLETAAVQLCKMEDSAVS